MMITPGRHFGPHMLERRIGKGGMGDVWLGIHDRLRRPAAVKLILPGKLAGADEERAKAIIQRFEREAEATAFLSSPHTVKLYDFGVSEDGLFFQVMELLEGCTLSELARQAGPMPVSRVIHFMRQACESLGEAHRQGLVHRDIKPANLFVCTVGLRRDFLKVLDFGLVIQDSEVESEERLTAANILAGTPGFIAPEALVSDGAVSAAFDVYALGVIAHELVSGERVFAGHTPYEVLERHVNEPARRLDDLREDVPKDFADVVMRCLRKEPEDRPRNATELAELLAACDDAGKWTESDAEMWWLGTSSAAPPSAPQPIDEAPTVIDPPLSDSNSLSAGRESLVVLPFENRSKNDDDAYFVEGLGEDLIVELSKIESLTVISKNSSRSQRQTPAREVCEEFQVKYAVEGSVRRAGNRLRVTAKLIEGATGECLWADKYDRELLDIFEVQDELVQAIVEALSLRLTEGDRGRRGIQGTDSMEALEATMRGREELLRQNRKSLDRASDLLQHAIDLDPGFARPYGTLAAMYILDFFDGGGDDPIVCLDRARHLGHSAIARDPNNPEALLALGFLALIERRHDDAMLLGQQLTRLDPAWGHVLIANILHYMGRDAEGLEHVHRSMRLDPLYPDMTLLWLGLAHFGLGNYDEAHDAFLKRTERNPSNDSTFMLLASTRGHLGDVEGAKEAWLRCNQVTPNYSMAHRAMILPYKDQPNTFWTVVEGLRKAGIATDLDP